MDLNALRELKLRFEVFSKQLMRNHLYCRFIPFDLIGPTWEKRMELRRLLVEDLEDVFKEFPENFPEDEDWKEKLLMPGSRPYIPDVSISISHCPLLGGYIFSLDKNVSLGLDIEKARRVNRSIQHVSSQKEMGESPVNSLLWVAKESAFKCVPTGGQQHFLSDIFIFDWKKIKWRDIGFGFK